MLFEVDNYIYDVKKQPAESDKYHNTKGNFIASLKPIDDEDFTYYEKMATIYANIIYLECSYKDEIINELNQLGENIEEFVKIQK